MEVCGMERETEAEKGANCSVQKWDGLVGCTGSSRHAKVHPEVCYGAKVWMGRGEHHIPMRCFLLQGMEIHVSVKPNS